MSVANGDGWILREEAEWISTSNSEKTRRRAHASIFPQNPFLRDMIFASQAGWLSKQRQSYACGFRRQLELLDKKPKIARRFLMPVLRRIK